MFKQEFAPRAQQFNSSINVRVRGTWFNVSQACKFEMRSLAYPVFLLDFQRTKKFTPRQREQFFRVLWVFYSVMSSFLVVSSPLDSIAWFASSNSMQFHSLYMDFYNFLSLFGLFNFYSSDESSGQLILQRWSQDARHIPIQRGDWVCLGGSKRSATKMPFRLV